LPSGITNEALFQWGVVIGASLVAAVCDLRTRRIPNVLTIPLLLVGLIRAAWLGGLSGLAEVLGTCFLLALPFVLLYLFAGGGAGDAKLMAALGAWLGIAQGITALLCVTIAGIVLAIAKAVMRKSLKLVLTNVFVFAYTFMLSLLGHKTEKLASQADSDQPARLTIPYGVAIFAGVCVAGCIDLLW
jgi:prepilin peptidase CpaA